MTRPPRKPSDLAYTAVRDADTTAEARQVYTAMRNSPCNTADICVMAAACPFVVDCMAVEGEHDDGR